MTEITIASWNIEHMHNWFDNTKSHVVDKLDPVATKVANIINKIKPQILCIQEGPTRLHQMENFVDDYLDGDWQVIVGQNGSSQKPYIIYQDFPGLQSVDKMVFDTTAWKYNFLEHQGKDNSYKKKRKSFSRLPVELIFNTSKGSFSVMSLHMKSKISFADSDIHSSNATRQAKAVGEAIEQRARILQEATLLRDYVQNHPFDDSIKGRMIVMGDLNDGPGKDYFETQFFSTDLLRRVRGDIDHVDEILDNGLERRKEDERFSAIFYDRIDKELRSLLLDHVLISKRLIRRRGLRASPQSAKVRHKEYNEENEANWNRKTKPDRLKYPSDHRPVSVKVRF